MDVVEVLEAYDQQLRRSMAAPTDAWTVELLTDPAPMLRVTAPDGASWGDGITWTDLDESTADAAIADAIEYFSTRGRGFEWKHHGYDAPPDLPDRLVAAGFRPEEQESDDEGRRDDWAAINTVHSTVWDEDAGPLVREVSAEQAADPSAMSVWVAEVPDGSLVCAAWIRCHEGTDFASLWGGSTLPQWRGRGIYKALVGHRADEAAQRGLRYLQVDASDDSRPILVRLGMHLLTSTTPYLWRPGT